MSSDAELVLTRTAGRQSRWSSNLVTRFALYAAIGALAFAADYCVFLVVFGSSKNPYIANLVGICTGIGVSFSLNRKYTFNRPDMVAVRSAKFVLVAIGGMALSSLAIAILISQHVDPRVAKIVAMIAVFGLQFTANALWTFR